MADRSLRLSKHYVLGDFLVDSTFPDLALILEPTPKTVDSLMRLELPAGVEVELKL